MELSNWRGSEGLTHRVFCLKCPSVSDRHRLEICRLNILCRSHLSSVAPLLTEHLLSSHTRILSLERHQRRQWEFSLSSLQAPHGVLGYSRGQLARTLGPALSWCEPRRKTVMLPGWFSLITHFTLWSDQFYNLVAKDLQLCSFYRFMGLHQLHR